MAEEIDDKVIAPGTMKLESGDKTIKVDPQASEASDNEVISPEDMKLETSEIMIDTEPPNSEASDSDVYPRKMEHDIVDQEEAEQLEEYYDSSFKEEGESSRAKSDTTEDNSTGQLRKKSTLIVVGSNHKFNVRSRYLSDPFNSCHDFCKFGHKHESETKTRRLTLGTVRESQPLIKTTSDEPEKSVLQKVTKKKELNRRVSLPGTIPEKASPMHLEEKKLPKEVTQSKMKRVESERKPSLAPSPITSSRSKTDTQAVKKTVTQSPNLQKTSTRKEVKTRKEVGSNSKSEMEVKEKEPSSSATSVNEEGSYSPITSSRSKTPTQAMKKTVTQSPNFQKTSTRKLKEVKTSKSEMEVKEKVPSSSAISVNEEGSHSLDVGEIKAKTTLKSVYNKVVKDIKVKKPSSNSPKTPLKRSSSLKARLYKDPRSSLSRNQIKSGEPKVAGHDDSIETKPETSESTVYGENSQQSSQETRPRKPQGFKGKGKGIGASSLSSSSRESSKLRRERLGSEVMKPKQRVFKTEESGSKTSTSREKSTTTRRLKSLDIKNTKQNDTTRNDSRSRTNTPREKLLVEQKWKPKTKEKTNAEEKDASAWKVKFKRGTVVALQVANNAPKRLRFRRARILGEDQVAKAEINHQLKNEHVIGNEESKIGPEKVRLRHQEASEKKDDVDLNNVIEETASKLVKTRKSKVKALVGAFETVMSLGDRKRLVEPGAS